MTRRVVVVSGGCRGIGRATAIAFANQGCDVVVTSRFRGACDEMESVAQGVLSGAVKGTVRGVVCDVSDAASIVAAHERTIAMFNRVDVLVNCAGMVIACLGYLNAL